MSRFPALSEEELVELTHHFRLERSYAYYNARLQQLAQLAIERPGTLNQLIHEFIQHTRTCDCWYCLSRKYNDLDFVDYYSLILFRLNGAIYVQMN